MTTKTVKQSGEMSVLANGNLPHRLIVLLKKTKFTAEDIVRWENSKPVLSLAVDDGELNLDLHLKLSVKKSLLVAGAIISGLSGLLQNWPSIQAFFQKLGTP